MGHMHFAFIQYDRVFEYLYVGGIPRNFYVTTMQMCVKLKSLMEIP